MTDVDFEAVVFSLLSSSIFFSVEAAELFSLSDGSGLEDSPTEISDSDIMLSVLDEDAFFTHEHNPHKIIKVSRNAVVFIFHVFLC